MWKVCISIIDMPRYKNWWCLTKSIPSHPQQKKGLAELPLRGKIWTERESTYKEKLWKMWINIISGRCLAYDFDEI